MPFLCVITMASHGNEEDQLVGDMLHMGIGSLLDSSDTENKNSEDEDANADEDKNEDDEQISASARSAMQASKRPATLLGYRTALRHVKKYYANKADDGWKKFLVDADGNELNQKPDFGISSRITAKE